MFELFRDPKVDFMGKRNLWLGISAALMAASLVAIPIFGIKRGIELGGGAEVQVKYATAPDVGSIRSTLGRAGFDSHLVTTIGAPEDHEVYIRVGLDDRGQAETAGEEVTARVIAALRTDERAGSFVVRSQSYIGPAIGRELVRKAIGAIVGSLVGMLGYIWFRFQFRWGLAAVVALVHDTVITLGLFTILGFEMSLPVVASFLTLIGYSVNDKVVVFDRMRENLKTHSGGDLMTLINDSMNQALSRTILTSTLTWIATIALFALGGPALRAFAFPLMVGIVVGTYSSMYTAAPFLLIWQRLAGPEPGAGAGPRVAGPGSAKVPARRA